MKFTENIPLTIQRPPQSGGGSHTGILYGSVQEKYLIAGGFEGTELEVGEEMMVRLSSGGHMLGFWARVIDRVEGVGRIEGAEVLYFLSFPEHVETLNMRKAERMNLFVPVQVRLTESAGGGEQIFEGALINLSSNGCCLNALTVLKDNPWCELRFHLPGVDQEFLVEGRVVRSGEERSKVSEMGVEFAGASGPVATAGKIRNWLESNLPLAQER